MKSAGGRIAAGIGVAGYAALVGWTAWLASERAEGPVRWLILLAAVVIASVFGSLVVASLAARAGRDGSDRPDQRRCRSISMMVVGPLAAILLLSGLYAAFRFEGFAALAAAAPLLLLGGAGLAAYATCPAQRGAPGDER